MASKNIKNKEVFGKVHIYQEKPKGAPRFYWRAVCRSKKCPTEWRYRNFENYSDAKRWALTVNSYFEYSKNLEISPERIVQFAEIEKTLKAAQLKKGFEEGKEVNSESSFADGSYLRKIIENGVHFSVALENVNKIRLGADEVALEPAWALDEWKKYAKKKLKPENTISFDAAISDFITLKSSDTGSNNKRKLGGGLAEWNTIVGKYLKSWVGKEVIGASSKKISDLVEKEIIKGKKTDGESWGDSYRHRIATKTKGFGGWIKKKYELAGNPFENLPEEFPAPEKEMVRYYKPDEVRALIRAAMFTDKGRMLDYFTFLFFSTLRPFEIAHQRKADRRLKYETFEGWRYRHSQPDGYEWTFKKFQIIGGKRVKRSKTKDRSPVLLDVGADWLKYQYKALPNTGEVLWRRSSFEKIKERFKKETKGNWIQDGARHTLLSYARKYPPFRDIQGYWARVAGHDLTTFEEYYSAPVTEEDSVEFFEQILPPANFQEHQKWKDGS